MNGANANPLFRFLRTNSRLYNKQNGSVKQLPWNFAKFLVDSNGKVIQYYEPAIDPANLEGDIL